MKFEPQSNCKKRFLADGADSPASGRWWRPLRRGHGRLAVCASSGDPVSSPETLRGQRGDPHGLEIHVVRVAVFVSFNTRGKGVLLPGTPASAVRGFDLCPRFSALRK